LKPQVSNHHRHLLSFFLFFFLPFPFLSFPFLSFPFLSFSVREKSSSSRLFYTGQRGGGGGIWFRFFLFSSFFCPASHMYISTYLNIRDGTGQTDGRTDTDPMAGSSSSIRFGFPLCGRSEKRGGRRKGKEREKKRKEKKREKKEKKNRTQGRSGPARSCPPHHPYIYT